MSFKKLLSCWQQASSCLFFIILRGATISRTIATVAAGVAGLLWLLVL
jgi:hypothetical protein